MCGKSGVTVGFGPLSGAVHDGLEPWEGSDGCPGLWRRFPPITEADARADRVEVAGKTVGWGRMRRPIGTRDPAKTVRDRNGAVSGWPSPDACAIIGEGNSLESPRPLATEKDP